MTRLARRWIAYQEEQEQEEEGKKKEERRRQIAPTTCNYLSLHTRILQPSSHSVNAEILKGPYKLLACFEKVELMFRASQENFQKKTKMSCSKG